MGATVMRSRRRQTTSFLFVSTVSALGYGSLCGIARQEALGDSHFTAKAPVSIPTSHKAVRGSKVHFGGDIENNHQVLPAQASVVACKSGGPMMPSGASSCHLCRTLPVPRHSNQHQPWSFACIKSKCNQNTLQGREYFLVKYLLLTSSAWLCLQIHLITYHKLFSSL